MHLRARSPAERERDHSSFLTESRIASQASMAVPTEPGPVTHFVYFLVKVMRASLAAHRGSSLLMYCVLRTRRMPLHKLPRSIHVSSNQSLLG